VPDNVSLFTPGAVLPAALPTATSAFAPATTGQNSDARYALLLRVLGQQAQQMQGDRQRQQMADALRGYSSPTQNQLMSPQAAAPEGAYAPAAGVQYG
jgi:hypothetical protein